MKKQFALLPMVLGVTLASSSAFAAANFVEGTDYKKLTSPVSVEVPGKIEVREFFWYGCPHCFKLEPYVANWLKTKPADVNFIRTPAAISPYWEPNARGFYAVDLMGKTSAVHSALFNAIHVQQQKLFDQASLADFYSRFGVDKAKFNSAYGSFAVSGKIAQSNALALKYKIDGVPALIVNGKYVVKGESGRSVDTVNYLINLERPKSTKK